MGETIELKDKRCLVCGLADSEKPMVFRGERWCSDLHRKVTLGELVPTPAELRSMDHRLFLEMDTFWEGTQNTTLTGDRK